MEPDITRLLELTRPSLEQAYSILDRAGFEEIAHGSYAEIFYRDGDPFVLRLYANSDQAYADFIEFAMDVTHRGNPHLPRFRGRPMKVNNEYSSVRMEKLAPCHMVDIVTDMQMFVVFREHYARHPKDDPKENPEYQKAIGILELKPKLLELLAALVDDLIVKHGYQDDIDINNVMMRANDTLVLIDPVCGKGF